MKNTRNLFLLGLLVFLVGSVGVFPARLGYAWFVPEPIKLGGIDGTIWQGRVREGVADGLFFTNLSWSFKPLALLKGVVAVATEVDTAGGHISMTAGIGLGGAVKISDLVGNLSLSSLHPALQQNRISGMLSIQMQSIEIKNGWPTQASGSIGIGNLVAGSLGADSIGSFRAEFRTENGNIRGIVKDAGAVLDVVGKIELGEDRSYSLVGNVSANHDTPPAIEQNLRFLGTPDQNGQRQFRFEGAL